jgi:hypothetical protein
MYSNRYLVQIPLNILCVVLSLNNKSTSLRLSSISIISLTELTVTPAISTPIENVATRHGFFFDIFVVTGLSHRVRAVPGSELRAYVFFSPSPSPAEPRPNAFFTNI